MQRQAKPRASIHGARLSLLSPTPWTTPPLRFGPTTPSPPQHNTIFPFRKHQQTAAPIKQSPSFPSPLLEIGLRRSGKFRTSLEDCVIGHSPNHLTWSLRLRLHRLCVTALLKSSSLELLSATNSFECPLHLIRIRQADLRCLASIPRRVL